MLRIRFFSPDSDPTLFLSPDPDRPKSGTDPENLDPKTGVKVEIFFIFHTPSFWSGSSKTLSKPSFRTHRFINGRIRIQTFKIRIQIDEKTQIHPDPKHCSQQPEPGKNSRSRPKRGRLLEP